MTTITEDYVSFETAKLLKEKGFDEETDYIFYHYEEDNDWCFEKFLLEDKFDNKKMLHCPTHQMACKWLRKKHQLHISVDVSPLYGKTKDEKGRNTCGLLYWHYMACGVWLNEKYNPHQKAFVVSAESNEQAIEKALKYCLENLI